METATLIEVFMVVVVVVLVADWIIDRSNRR